MRETAYAKINLALHVRAREPDGYHRLETLFAFAEDGDTITATPADALSLSISGPFAHGLGTGSDNLVMRAAEALHSASRTPQGAALHLVKNLPVASGIGGGSADAAAALRLLDRLWNLGVGEARLADLARDLGADVPACVVSRTVRGEGRGDRLLPVSMTELEGVHLLLVNPGAALATAPVFQGWDGVDRGALEDFRHGRNDLEAPARKLVPEIGDVLSALSDADLARMSGSGATCFGLYGDAVSRDAAAARIRQAQPHWWCLATRLR